MISIFFGEFKVECLYPFIKKHGNPFPEISQPKGRKQVNTNHQPVESTPKVPHTRIVREHFSVKDPIHRFRYINLMENESSDSESETIRDYATVFGTFDHDAFEDVSSIQGDELLNGTLVSLESPRDIPDEFVSNSANVESNKTGTPEVGALSEAQAAQNPFLKKLFWISEVFWVFLFQRMSHSAEKSKKGDTLCFNNIHSVAQYQKTRKGDSFETIKNFRKMSHNAEKRKGDPFVSSCLVDYV